MFYKLLQHTKTRTISDIVAIKKNIYIRHHKKWDCLKKETG